MAGVISFLGYLLWKLDREVWGQDVLCSGWGDSIHVHSCTDVRQPWLLGGKTFSLFRGGREKRKHGKTRHRHPKGIFQEEKWRAGGLEWLLMYKLKFRGYSIIQGQTQLDHIHPFDLLINWQIFGAPVIVCDTVCVKYLQSRPILWGASESTRCPCEKRRAQDVSRTWGNLGEEYKPVKWTLKAMPSGKAMGTSTERKQCFMVPTHPLNGWSESSLKLLSSKEIGGVLGPWKHGEGQGPQAQVLQTAFYLTSCHSYDGFFFSLL